ncbi:hypothetical protein [Erwinia sp. E_sp_B01_9]|uniref:hypothetical protein n=1 Tax=Erwinia sp. E_sp_B01_9 TaxID=3039403 RepID=UPI003D9AC393
MYDMSVYVVKEGKPVEVNRKQGTIDYLVSPRGIITSATDAFMLRGKKVSLRPPTLSIRNCG